MGDVIDLYDRCASCAFFLGGDPKFELGICRRYPPAALPPDDKGDVEQGWPIVGTNDWCGEYEEGIWKRRESDS